MSLTIVRPSCAEAELLAWIAEFEAAARRPLKVRLRYAFVKTYKPVLDDATYRSSIAWKSIANDVNPHSLRGWAMAAVDL